MAQSALHNCNVCGANLERILYRSLGGASITSLCEVWQGETVVRGCMRCSHIQTDELPDLEVYYDHEYKILVESEEEDQIYKVVNGKPVYRTDHQIEVLLSKVTPPSGALVLDYGCAKGASLRRLKQLRPDIVPHLFDVSTRYVDFWKAFASSDNWATYTPPDHWMSRFDLVTSFYALEHMAHPHEALTAISKMLKPDGIMYGVVPNVVTNPADFIVADHVNHFTVSSLRRLMEQCGFRVCSIDDTVHEGAFIFIAQLGREQARTQTTETKFDPAVEHLAKYWSSASTQVREFEAANSTGRRAAIYGSGFYGTFIATCLRDLSSIECFLDQNPHRQGKPLLDRPILAPAELSPDVENVYVGLNPRTARENIAGVREWANRSYRYFYL